MRRALVLGVTGQDGSYLTDSLLERGYEVHGFHRRTSLGNFSRVEHVKDKIVWHRGDLTDATSVYRALGDSNPHECYNMADQDNVDWSYQSVGYSLDVTAAAVGRLLEIVRQLKCPSVRVFQPCSATMFGDAQPPQSEETPLAPMSPYACAKACAYHLCRFYRQAYGMFVSTAIFYNHDSPRRGNDYLLHTIARQSIEVARGKRDMVLVGDPDGVVDIGHAAEYAEAAWKILQLGAPDDYVVGTGKSHTVKQVAGATLVEAGGPPSAVGRDPEFHRPGAKQNLVADCAKAREAFGWQPKSDAIDMARIITAHYQGYY